MRPASGLPPRAPPSVHSPRVGERRDSVTRWRMPLLESLLDSGPDLRPALPNHVFFRIGLAQLPEDGELARHCLALSMLLLAQLLSTLHRLPDLLPPVGFHHVFAGPSHPR